MAGTERVARVDLALGDALDLRIVERVDLVLAGRVPVLRQQLAQHRLPLAHVRALEPDPQLLPDGDDAFARTVERTGVGRESDVLLLYGRIDVDLLEVAPLRDLAPHGGRDGFLVLLDLLFIWFALFPCVTF